MSASRAAAGPAMFTSQSLRAVVKPGSVHFGEHRLDDVVHQIDVQGTLREKLDAEMEPSLILGDCNPTFAHRALELEPELGALLPCNVVVYERDGATHVSAVDPVAMLGIVENPGLEPIGRQIRERVERAVEAVWKA